MRTPLFAAVVILAAMPILGHSQATARPVPSAPHRDAQPTSGLLDINTATLEQLKALPGFGAAYANRVIAGRPYMAKNQLVTRGILPANAYSKVAPLIIAHHPHQ